MKDITQVDDNHKEEVERHDVTMFIYQSGGFCFTTAGSWESWRDWREDENCK